MSKIEFSNLRELKYEELISITGGDFACDVGWFIGTLFSGRGLTLQGINEALVDYRINQM